MAQPQIPEYLKAFAAKTRILNEASIAGISSFQLPPHISIDKQRFTLVNAKGERTTLREFELEVVVVGSNPVVSRLYYGRPYDGGAEDRDPPKCFSDNGTAPSARALDPQNVTCQGCPHAEWGSATGLKGKPIPACSERKKLAVLFNNYTYGDGEDHWELYMLVIPPNSLGKWQEHASFVGKHPDASIAAIRTLVTFDEKVQGTLNFKALGWITAETMEEVQKVSEQSIVVMVGADDKPRTAALPAPALGGAPTPQSQQQIAASKSDSFKEPTGPERVMAEKVAPKASPKADDTWGTDTPAPAPTKPKGRPPKGNGAAFGMQEANTVSDPVLEKSLADALGWTPE